jgi:exonuclease III
MSQTGVNITATDPAQSGTPDNAASGCNVKPAKNCTLSLAKQRLNLATWYVRTLLQPGTTSLLANTLEHHNIDLACIQETRIQGTDSVFLRNTRDKPTYKLYNSGYSSPIGLHGVAIAVCSTILDTVMEWRPVNPRLCYIRLNAKPTRLSIICAYAPTEDKTDTEKDEFYNELSDLLNSTPKCDLIYIGGDLNAKVGQARNGEEKSVERFTIGTRNNNGDRLVQFACLNNMVLSNTTFQKKIATLHTWRSNDHKTKNQIDYIMVNRRWGTSVEDVASVPFNTPLESDHRILKALTYET